MFIQLITADDLLDIGTVIRVVAINCYVHAGNGSSNADTEVRISFITPHAQQVQSLAIYVINDKWVLVQF